MNFLTGSFVIGVIFTTACYGTVTPLPEKNLLEKITDFFFAEVPTEKPAPADSEKNASDSVKKISTVEPSKESKKGSKKVAKKAPSKPLPEISVGNKNAPVVMINYSSLTCGHCARFYTDTLPEIKEKYIDPGYLRIIFRDYPGDQVSLKAHQVAWCKGEMKYLDLMKILYAAQDKWISADDPVAALKAVALQNGITPQQFDACLKNQELLDQIIAQRLEGRSKYNIKATPTIIINAKIYQEALNPDELDNIMKPLLAVSKDKSAKS